MKNNFTTTQKKFLNTLKRLKLYAMFRLYCITIINIWIEEEILLPTDAREELKRIIDRLVTYQQNNGMKYTVELIKNSYKKAAENKTRINNFII